MCRPERKLSPSSAGWNGVGDTLPNTGDVIRFIGSDGVRLYSPSRNAEWTLPYSGDDI